MRKDDRRSVSFIDGKGLSANKNVQMTPAAIKRRIRVICLFNAFIVLQSVCFLLTQRQGKNVVVISDCSQSDIVGMAFFRHIVLHYDVMMTNVYFPAFSCRTRM